MCDRKQGFFFFSRHGQPPLGLWLSTLQCEWINILLRTPFIWLLLDRNALHFPLHIAESVVREIQKTKRSVIVLFLSSSCSESIRFRLVVCIFCGSPSFLGKMNKNRLIALWSWISFMRTTLNLDQFFLVHRQMMTYFSITIMGSYTSWNNCRGQWRHKSTGHVRH